MFHLFGSQPSTPQGQENCLVKVVIFASYHISQYKCLDPALQEKFCYILLHTYMRLTSRLLTLAPHWLKAGTIKGVKIPLLWWKRVK